MATYYNVITGSRIADSTWADQSGSDDTAVTGWAIGDDFILVVHMDDNSKNTEAGTYKLQWKKGAGGTFADLAATGELNYSVGGATSLTDGSPLTSGEGICSNKQGSGWTWVDGTEREDSNNTVAFDGSDEDETEHAWAIACDGATASETYYFQLVDTANGNRVDSISVTITMAAGLTHYTLQVLAGAFAFAGTAVDLLKGYHVDASVGAFTYAGQDTTLSRTRELVPAAGAFPYAGTAVDLLKGYEIAPSSGAFAYAGQDVTFKKGYIVVLTTGAFALAGSDVTLSRTRELVPASGAFAFSGQDVSLERGYEIVPSAGSFAFAGQNVSLLKGYIVVPGAGAFPFTGINTDLLKGYEIIPGTVNFPLAGSDVTLTYTAGEVEEVAAVETHGYLKRKKRPIRIEKIDEEKEIMQIIESIIASGMLD